MSDTPRTDAEESRYYGKWANSDFAREIERELATALKQRDTLVEALKEIQWSNCSCCQRARAFYALETIKGANQ